VLKLYRQMGYRSRVEPTLELQGQNSIQHSQ